MVVSDDSLNKPQVITPRLYKGVISTLEVIKILGLIGNVLWGIALGQEDVALGFIIFLTSAFTIYIAMTSSIAVIDLLSRIEHNTRKPQSINIERDTPKPQPKNTKQDIPKPQSTNQVKSNWSINQEESDW